ncbi:MAG: hypothetical protein ACRDOL_33260, partial [Streptosporangiaceae bacterium]
RDRVRQAAAEARQARELAAAEATARLTFPRVEEAAYAAAVQAKEVFRCAADPRTDRRGLQGALDQLHLLVGQLEQQARIYHEAVGQAARLESLAILPAGVATSGQLLHGPAALRPVRAVIQPTAPPPVPGGIPGRRNRRNET